MESLPMLYLISSVWDEMRPKDDLLSKYLSRYIDWLEQHDFSLNLQAEIPNCNLSLFAELQS